MASPAHSLGFISPQNAAAPASGRHWMLLVPKGTNHGRDGRGPFHAGGRAEMEAIVQRTKASAGATELMVDYDHQSVHAAVPGVGGRAVAAGWVKEFRVTDRGIEGLIEWTDAARAAIRAKEYRYLSPTLRHDKENRIVALHSVGLVNTPNFDLEAVAASASPHAKGKSMLEKIAKALGLPETATEEQILEEIAAKLNDTAALKADPSKFVPMSAFEDVVRQLNNTRSGFSKREAEREVEYQIELGRIAPSAKDWAVDLIQTNKAAYDGFLTRISPMGFGPNGIRQPQLGDRRPEARTSTAENDIISKLGLSADDFKKYGRS